MNANVNAVYDENENRKNDLHFEEKNDVVKAVTEEDEVQYENESESERKDVAQIAILNSVHKHDVVGREQDVKNGNDLQTREQAQSNK